MLMVVELILEKATKLRSDLDIFYQKQLTCLGPKEINMLFFSSNLKRKNQGNAGTNNAIFYF